MGSARVRVPNWLGGGPTLSLGLAAVWVLVTLAVTLGFASRLQQIEREIQTAASFAIRDPIVYVEPHFIPVVRGFMPTFENDEVLGFLRRKEAHSDGPTAQEQFDRLVAVALKTLEGHPYRAFGVVPAQLSVHSFATHVFIHSGWLHLVPTLVLFLLAAPLLEQMWGRGVLAGALVLLALAGAGAFCLVHPGANRALVGGSAVVAGLVAAVVTRFRAEELDFMGWLAPVAEVELSAPAWGLCVIWAVYELFLWWGVQGALPSGVDNAVGYTAHAAGAAVGGLLPLIISRLGWEKSDRHPGLGPAKRRGRTVERFDLKRALAMREKGEEDEAFAMLEAEVKRSVRNRDVVTAFWQMAVERGVPDQAAPAVVQLIREELRRGADEVAVALWHSLLGRLPSTLVDPASLVRLAPTIARVEGEEQAVLALEQALDERNKGLTPSAAARAAQLAAEYEQPELALAAARKALTAKGLDDGQRAELAALVQKIAPSDPSRERDKRKTEASVFFEEADRSAFGEVSDLSLLDDSFPDGVVTEAVPKAVGEEGLEVVAAGREGSSIAYGRLRAVALAAAHGLGPKPVVLVDLLIDGDAMERPLAVVRLRGDRFDPRKLIPGAAGALDALRCLVEGLLSRSGARPLPDAEAAAARPVRVFESIEAYHEEVLRPVAKKLRIAG